MAASRNSRSPDLPGVLARRLAELLAAGEGDPASPAFPPASPRNSPRNLAIALSGGRDSVALLAALAQAAPARGWSLAAVHVHHGLSPHADAWADFCARLCADLGVPLAVHRVQVGDAAGQGLEAAARQARYRVFAGLSAEALVLGHHREDQAETLLFNLLRGSGLRGLAAMPARRLLPRPGRAPLALLRPLLELPRAAIEAWLKAQGLAWIEDESNADSAYSRNFLRREVLPLLQSRFPAVASLGRAARLAGEAEELLEEVAAQDRAAAGPGDELPVAALAALSPARRRNLLRFWLRQGGAPMPDAAALEELLRQVAAPRPDGQAAWHCGGWVVHCWQGRLYLEAAAPTAALPEQPWRGEVAVAWGGSVVRSRAVRGGGIAARHLAAGAHLAPRRGGERLALPGRPHKTLKQLLQEAQVPPWRRAGLPLLWIGGTLAWVPGLGVAAPFRCGPREPGWELSWEPDGTERPPGS